MKLAMIGPLTIILFLLAAHGPRIQIKIPNTRFKERERISAEVDNRGETPITFCVEYGRTSPTQDENQSESTPSPFNVQANSSGKWNTLLIGPDVGSFQAPIVLEGNKSSEFPFMLRTKGKMRLVLWYWDKAMPDLDCKHPPNGEKRLESLPFLVE